MFLSQAEGSGAFKGFKGFSLSAAAAAGGASAPAAFSGFGNGGGGFKGLSSLTNGNSIAPSFGGFSSPAATTTAAPGEERLLIGSLTHTAALVFPVFPVFPLSSSPASLC